MKNIVNYKNFSGRRVAKVIDQTLVKPTTTQKEVFDLCMEAKKYGFAAVCVSPTYAFTVSRLLKGTGIKTCVVVGFPFGANLTETKVFEAEKAVRDGAQEIDMVMNVGMFKSGNFRFVEEDIMAVVEKMKPKNIVVKVIIETCYLTDEEKIKASKLVMGTGADYIKTSTGYGFKGATIHDIKLIKNVVGNKIGIKASGGIRTYRKALAMIKAGATKIGTSTGVKIVETAEKIG